MSAHEFDVIVAGGGLGGMLAAAMLAGRGRRVLLLEREEQLGGRLRSYDVDGFVVDAGAYLWPDAHLGAALKQAGASDFLVSRIPGDQVMRIFVQGTGGRRFSFPWPGRPESAKTVAVARAALRIDADTFRDLLRLWDRLASLTDAEVDAVRHLPARDALPRFAPDAGLRDAFLRNVMLFGTCDPGSAAMGDCIALRRRDPTAPLPFPECAGANESGGVRALVQSLQRALAARAVEVRLGWRVEQIAIESGSVQGVWASGASPFREFLAAPAVISNLPIWTLFDVVSPDLFPADFVRNARAFAAVGGVIAAAFAFDALPRLRDGGEPDRFLGWTRLLIGATAEFGGGMLWSSHHSPGNAPAGRHVLQAMRLSPHSEIADASRVERVQAAFRELLDEIYVDAGEKLLWRREWVTRDGSEYMITAAPRPPVRAPGVRGLFFVGETTDVPAVQMDAAALSALRAAEMVAAE